MRAVLLTIALSALVAISPPPAAATHLGPQVPTVEQTRRAVERDLARERAWWTSQKNVRFSGKITICAYAGGPVCVAKYTIHDPELGGDERTTCRLKVRGEFRNGRVHLHALVDECDLAAPTIEGQ
jgi:hypothetical protein